MKFCDGNGNKAGREAGGINGGRRSSSNCLSCFRPLVYEIDQVGDKILFYSTEHLPRKQIKSESLEKDENSPCRKRRSFSRIIKAVRFQIKLARSKDQEKRSDSNRSFRKFDFKMGLVKSVSKRSTQSVSSCSSSSQFCTASSCVSSQTSEPDIPISSKQNKEKQSSIKKQRIVLRLSSSIHSSSPIINGMIMFVISLCLTVLWGKLCAIALTSIWLYLVTGRARLDRLSEIEKAHMEILMESNSEQKRRVIMKGLLDRQHYHSHTAALNFDAETDVVNSDGTPSTDSD